ncbi:MAG TPA: hypothetical protein VFO73_02595 [Candidatus Limnocylindrales bacterium]|nr:hypothetical protein [Candidatus Limnocylindrales bacterium]
MIMRRLAILCLLVLSACATDPPAPGAEVVAAAADTSGPFRLTFVLPRAFWTEADSITGEATLALVDGTARPIWGSGHGVIGFAFKEVGGTREMGPAWNLDCGKHSLMPDQPLVSAMVKSGGFGNDEPDAAFYRAFFRDPLVHLPAGTWDITAIADFLDGPSCSGAHHEMSATIRIDVGR